MLTRFLTLLLFFCGGAVVTAEDYYIIEHQGELSPYWLYKRDKSNTLTWLTHTTEDEREDKRTYISLYTYPDNYEYNTNPENFDIDPLAALYLHQTFNYDVEISFNARVMRITNDNDYINGAYRDYPKYKIGDYEGYIKIDKGMLNSVHYSICFFIDEDNLVIIHGSIDNGSKGVSDNLFQKCEGLIQQHIKELKFTMVSGSGKKTSGSAVDTEDDEDEDEDEDDEAEEGIPWTTIIGTLTAGGAALLARKLLSGSSKGGKTGNKKEKDKKEKEKEKAHYVLQLNKKKFQLKLNTPELLTAVVYKITESGQKKISARLYIENHESALQINPSQGNGSLNSQLMLKSSPGQSSFNIHVVAEADGQRYQQAVTIEAEVNHSLLIETVPNNKRTLRPDTYQTLSCYARVVDESGQTDAELTQKLKFEPQNNWIDLSEPKIENDKAVIHIGCSSPNPTVNLTPPPSVVLSVWMGETGGHDRALRQDVRIDLVDCLLEVEADEFSFPLSGETSRVSFWAAIENAGDESGWNFAGEYRHGVTPTDPLTEIYITQKSDLKAEITLEGPIIDLKDGQAHLSRDLVISAWQGDEKPLERRLNVIVTAEGLIIKYGLNEQNELNFVADSAKSVNLDFALYVYDQSSNQVLTDSQALHNLEFELISEEREIQNLVSVLKPEFEFAGLHGNVPFGKYKLTTQTDIPGTGDIFPIKYRAIAPVGAVSNSELFEKEFTIMLKTYGVGEDFSDWSAAYNECLRVLYTHVPDGAEKTKLYEMLQERKMTLGVEGLNEFRKQIWSIAQKLILAEGERGYRDMERWANTITHTLEWAEWAGDLAFNAVAAFYFKGLGATAASMVKAGMIEALNFYIYDYDKGIEYFVRKQLEKIIPYLLSSTKGRIISVDNIEKFVGERKALAWTIYASIEFLYNLYQTKSVVEAAKATARQLRDEWIVKFLTKQLQNEALNLKVEVINPVELFGDILKNVKEVNGKEVLDRAKLLEIMKDPTKVRTIKDKGSNYIKKLFNDSRQEIYNQHDAQLKKFIHEKYNISPADIQIQEFRTPGTDPNKIDVNTDRDYRVMKRVKTESGEMWIELQRPNWLSQSYDIFGKLTGKPGGVDSKLWAEKHLQRGTDRFDVEASLDYTDHIYNPETGRVEIDESNITKVLRDGKKLLDPEGLGNMYKTKVENAIKDGYAAEAYAQAKKGVKTLEKVREAYQNKEGLQQLPENFEKAMNLVKNAKVDVEATPRYLSQLANSLKSVGFESMEQFSTEMAKHFKNLDI